MIAGAAAHLLEPPLNVLRLRLHPEGIAPRIINLAEWRSQILARLGRQAVLCGDPALFALHDELASSPSGERADRVDIDAGSIGSAPAGERCRRARLHQHRHQVRRPPDVIVSELALGSFFPVDAHTARALAMASATDAP